MAPEPTTQPKESEAARDQRRAREATQETYQATTRAALAWIWLGPVVCIAALWALKDALITADEFIKEKAEFATEPFMPVFLLVAVGVVCAAFLTWRVTQSSGAVGKPVYIVAGGGVLLTALACVVAGLAIFNSGLPGVVLLSIVLKACAGILAVFAVGQVMG